MSDALLQVLDDNSGCITRSDALAVVGHDVLDRMAADGRVLQRVFPGVFVLSAFADDRHTRRLAALTYVRDGALSHLDALDVWDLPCESAHPSDTRVHVTVHGGRAVSRVTGIRFHRRRGFSIGPPNTVIRKGCEVVRLEQAVIESWPLTAALDRRAPAIVAVRDRRTTPKRLLTTLQSQPKASGAPEMRTLFAALKAGCRSELEIWGHASVFSQPGFPVSEGQHLVRIGKRNLYLDRAFIEEMVNVEMDGAAYHSAPGQRERDLRRDALLARLGWLVVRVSHQRLHEDPAGVLAEVLDVLRMRRRQFGLRAI